MPCCYVLIHESCHKLTQPVPIDTMQPATQASPETDEAVDTPCSPKMDIVELFESEESALIRYAYSLVKRREVAEEMVQDGFLKLHQHWGELENPRAWVYKAVRNLCFNHIRKFKREVVDDKVVDINSGSSGLVVERMETIGNVRLLMADWPEQDRALVQLKYNEGKSYTEIAESTGLTVSNIGYKLHHLLKSLGEELKKLGVESSRG